MDRDFFIKIINEWKIIWSNQTVNEKDTKRYRKRAQGVDANMKYHLADMLSDAVKEELKERGE